MTTVFFIRHAESDKSVDGQIRPLSEKGRRDAQALAERLRDIPFDRIYSSPYRRALDTVAPLAARLGLDVIQVEDFREWRSDSVQTIPLAELLALQWSDFAYTPSDGECFGAVQRRNLAALRRVLSEADGGTIAIGTHGVAMCTMLHAFSPISWEHFSEILKITPYLVRAEFDGQTFRTMEELV